MHGVDVKRGDWAGHPILRGEGNNHRVVRAATLEQQLKMPRRTIYRRCLPDGPWHRLLPGIVLLTPGEPTDRQRLEAAVLRGGPAVLITGLWAARLHGLKRIPTPDSIHILVPAEREIGSVGFTSVERTTRLPSTVRRAGLPLAPVHRAVLDAVRRIRDFDTVRALLAESVQRRMCTPQQLSWELDHGSQRGSALPRRALVELLGGAHSVAEGDAFWLWQRAGLPECERNVAVYDSAGKYVGKPDSWCDEVALAWEIDSKECHFGSADYAKTLARNTRYAAAGVVVVQTLPSRIREEPETVIRELSDAYEAARRRPRPPVRTA